MSGVRQVRGADVFRPTEGNTAGVDIARHTLTPRRRRLARLEELAEAIAKLPPVSKKRLKSIVADHAEHSFDTETFAAMIQGIADAGEVLDKVRSKRAVIAVGASIVILSALILAFWPRLPSVFIALVLQGATGGFLGPAIAAISLGLVGHAALAERLGRNQRFASTGALAGAALMRLIPADDKWNSTQSRVHDKVRTIVRH